MKICPKCNIEHANPGKFCSRSCANSRGPRTAEFKKNVSNKLTGKPSPHKGVKHFTQPRIIKICPMCGEEFSVTKSGDKKIYCGKQCYLVDYKLQFRKKTPGGQRKGSGRSKSGHYKGIYCASTYELAWVIYNLDHNVEFTRFPGFLEKNGFKYYPDFLIQNTIIEIKGYEWCNTVSKKTELAKSFGYTVLLLKKEDLKKEFEWVKSRYQYKELYELYDDYAPLYDLECSNCKSKFTRNKKPKTNIVYCCRICAGKGNDSSLIRKKHILPN